MTGPIFNILKNSMTKTAYTKNGKKEIKFSPILKGRKIKVDNFLRTKTYLTQIYIPNKRTNYCK
jgi:hypothetical protein